MKNQNIRTLVLATLAIGTACVTSSAATISVNLNFETGRQGQTVTGTAGFIPVGNWNNVAGGSPYGSWTMASLVDSAGTTTAAGITATSTNTGSDALWGAGGSGTPDKNLMAGGLQMRNNTANLSLTGLTAAVGGSYDVYVYFSLSGPGGDVTNLLNGVTSNTIVTSAFSGSFVDGTNGTGNYVKFSGISGDTLTLKSNRTPAGVEPFTNVAGIQIVPVPEPSTLGLLGLGFIGLAARRRRA